MAVSLRSWLPATALGLASLAALAVVALAPSPDQPVAVFFPPGTTAETALLHTVAAGGLPVRDGGWPGVVIARSDDPGFASALYREGAWFVLSAGGAAGCGETINEQRRAPLAPAA
jgi:hypothetical protein